MRNFVTKPLLAVAALSLLALAGCNQIDPLKRPYMWEETGVNNSNIAAMAANPADLTHGRDTPQHRVRLESDSVESLYGGKPKPLLSAGGSSGSSGAPATTGGGS
jgi:type IV pilus biogenesis protein CpaD/CtpE